MICFAAFLIYDVTVTVTLGLVFSEHVKLVLAKFINFAYLLYIHWSLLVPRAINPDLLRNIAKILRNNTK